MSQTPARKLRTWSRFGQIRRVPSEYEIVTHDANYTTRKNRVAALEGNPTAPVNMWYLTYRDHSRYKRRIGMVFGTLMNSRIASM